MDTRGIGEEREGGRNDLDTVLIYEILQHFFYLFMFLTKSLSFYLPIKTQESNVGMNTYSSERLSS